MQQEDIRPQTALHPHRIPIVSTLDTTIPIRHNNGATYDPNPARNTYDPATGRRIAVTDALTNTTHSAYNAEGQLIATWGSTYPVAYAYDAYGRMTAMYTYRGTNEINSADDLFTLPTDRTTWSYDDATGLLTNKLYADNLGPAYTYTPDGKLATRTWARLDPGTGLPLQTLYAYDPIGQLQSVTYSDDTPSVSYTYDRLGRQATVTDAQGTRTNVYDAATLALTEEQLPDGTVLTRQQDTYGRASGISLGDDYEVNYGYDGYGRFHSVSSAYSVVEYSYLPDTSLISGYSIVGQAPSPVLSVARAYEPNRNLITGIENQWGTNLVSSFAYENDAIGRRTARIDTHPFVVPPSGGSSTNTFDYNLRSEVVSALMGTNTYGYAYDPIGNRQQSTRNQEQRTYLANALNQYTNITDGVTNSPTYDLDGNMTANGDWTYTWNGENRLVGASNGAVVVSFAYDYMGRRFQKISGGVTNTFLYDGWNLIAEDDGTTTTHYVWGLDLSGSMQGAGGIGGLLATVQDGESYFSAFDANGNLTDYVDTNGTVVAHYEYDAFGNTITSTGDKKDDFRFRFSNKYLDEETSLYYYGYRYYSPQLGRWISRDPLGEAHFLDNWLKGRYGREWIAIWWRAKRPLYLFANNAPQLFVDLLGLDNPGSGGQNQVCCATSPPPPGGGDEDGASIACQCCAGAVGGNVLLQLALEQIDGTDDPGGGNAFRHCLASCQTSRACGRGCSQDFWDGRETPGTPADDQDLANNAVGRGIQGSCWDGCMDAWNNGGLNCGGNPCPPRVMPPPLPDPPFGDMPGW